MVPPNFPLFWMIFRSDRTGPIVEPDPLPRSFIVVMVAVAPIAFVLGYWLGTL